LFKRFWNINIENGFGIYILKFEAQIMAKNIIENQHSNFTYEQVKFLKKNVNWSKIGVGIKIFFKVTIFSINVHTDELLAHKVEGFIAWES
jgi:hypothetical protein